MGATSRRRFLVISGAAGASAAGVAGLAVGAGSSGPAGGVPVVLDGVETASVTTLVPFRDALRVPPVIAPRGDGVVEVALTEAKVRLHSQLPPTRMWTFQGHYPGPTFEVRRGQRVRVAWTNRLTGTMPVKGAWQAAPAGTTAPDLSTLGTPGSAGALVRPEVAAITGWTTTHLHGGHQHSVSDGGADLAVTPGGTQLAEYPNEVAATQLFYHDHAMPITGLNVMAGLVGTYLVRDEDEKRLNLPSGDREIPLLIADVNFETDGSGRLTGELLAKRMYVPTPMVPVPSPDKMPLGVQFMGPYTMVNGVVWPHLDVEQDTYRFRVVNVSNARPYFLCLIDEATGKPVKGAMQVIGTDLGLLDRPQPVDAYLQLASAERVDLLVDFSQFPGRKLTLVNAQPPVPGVPVPPPGTPFPAAGLWNPQVMQFRVAERAKGKPSHVPGKLLPSFSRLTPAGVPSDATERFVCLAFGKMGMPQMWELTEDPAAKAPADGVVQLTTTDGKTRTFRRTAEMFEDAPGFYAAPQTWEKWTIFSVAPPGNPIVHPLHIHLLDFQLLERHALDGAGMDFALGGTRSPVKPVAPIPVGPTETGWKDTVLLPPNSMVTIAGKFAEHTGRFMYHCHILDHEDEGMMRPLMVLPPGVLAMHRLMSGMSGPMDVMPGMS